MDRNDVLASVLAEAQGINDPKARQQRLAALLAGQQQGTPNLLTAPFTQGWLPALKALADAKIKQFKDGGK